MASQEKMDKEIIIRARDALDAVLNGELEIQDAPVVIINLQGNSKTRKKSSTNVKYDDYFEMAWKLWPRKTNKAFAQRTWYAKQKAKKLPDIETLMSALRTQIREDFSKRETQFIPHFSTWLSGERWNDSLARVGSSSDKYQHGMSDIMQFLESQHSDESTKDTFCDETFSEYRAYVLATKETVTYEKWKRLFLVEEDNVVPIKR